MILDRAESTDIETVLIAGKVVLDDGEITMVDEHKIRDEYNEEIEKGLFELDGPWARWAELSFEVEPYLFDFYRPWAEGTDGNRLRVQHDDRSRRVHRWPPDRRRRGPMTSVCDSLRDSCKPIWRVLHTHPLRRGDGGRNASRA